MTNDLTPDPFPKGKGNQKARGNRDRGEVKSRR